MKNSTKIQLGIPMTITVFLFFSFILSIFETENCIYPNDYFLNKTPVDSNAIPQAY